MYSLALWWPARYSAKQNTLKKYPNEIIVSKDYAYASESELAERIGALRLGSGERVPEWLQPAESPFTWQPTRFEDVSPQEVISLAKEKAEYDDLPLDKYIRLLTLVYEYGHQGKFDEAQVLTETAESLLAEEGGFGFTRATKHILLATQAHLLAMQGQEEQSRQKCTRLEPYDAMPSTEQAAVQALKAKFFSLYRKKGFQHAAECSQKALELNPDEPMWMFLVAESLRRQAKYFPTNEIPRDELHLLEKAVERERNATYMVHLALRYSTCATAAHKRHRRDAGFMSSELNRTITRMWDEATRLCKEALELEPNNEVINRRCGHTLMKCSKDTQLRNKELIKASLEKALELSPDSSMTCHYLGKYYMELEYNPTKAEEYFQKAAQADSNLPAQFDLIRIRFKMFGTERYDPLPDYEKFLQQQEPIERGNWLQVMAHIGSYHLIVNRDLRRALEYFETIINENEQFNFMKNHFLSYMENARPIDLYQYLSNEIMLNEISNKTELLRKIENISTESVKRIADEHLIDGILAEIRRSNARNTGRSTRADANSSEALSWRSNQNQNHERQNQGRFAGNRSSERSNWRQSGRTPSENANWRNRTPSQEE